MSTRTVYLMDEIDSSLAGQVIASLLALDQRSHKPIRLFVKSGGGDWDNARRICDTILDQIKSPVITIAEHHAESGAAAIVASGALRVSFAKAKFMFHKVYDEIQQHEVGKKREDEDFFRLGNNYAADYRDYLSYCTRKVKTHLVKCTLLPRYLRGRIARAKNGEYTISAREAKELGFIDAVITNVDGLKRFERLLIRKEKNVRK